MTKYKVICNSWNKCACIFHNEKPSTRKEIIYRFATCFSQHGIFKPANFKTIQYFYNVKIVKIKT